MTAQNRDDFTDKIKRVLALRASYRCSFTDCGRTTTGPSAEGPAEVTNVGEAAHICAASPGGKRYDKTMLSEERSAIQNGIWLCNHHAKMIDDDDATYTGDILHEMKSRHEAACARELLGATERAEARVDLIAIGPDVVGVGVLTGVAESTWSVRIQHFLVGDMRALIAYSERFGNARLEDQYVIVNELGDGRSLLKAPTFTSAAGGYDIVCNVAKSFPRISAAELPRDLKLESGDLVIENGDFAMVGGLDALPQKIRNNLVIQKGGYIFHPHYGSRLLEYFGLFHSSPWLDSMLKLDIIRLSAIPYNDEATHKETTPLQCVDEVVSAKTTYESNGRLSISVGLLVRGVGLWSYETELASGSGQA